MRNPHLLLCILSPSLSLFFFFFFFFSFFASFHGVHSNFSAICDPNSPPLLCGKVPLRYPFWNLSDTGSPMHCGYPGFGLHCPYGSVHPTLSLPGDTYLVTEINYDNKTLTLVDNDVAHQRCPRARHNLTLDSLPLNYNFVNVNLTFVFNCTAPPAASIPADPVPIDCLRSDDNWSYVFVNKSWEEVAAFGEESDCEDVVVAAVKRTDVTMWNVSEEFAGAMTEGFVLDWGTATECGKCEHSLGRCAVDKKEKLQCFCGDEKIHSGGSFCKGKERGLCPFIFSLSSEMVPLPMIPFSNACRLSVACALVSPAHVLAFQQLLELEKYMLAWSIYSFSLLESLVQEFKLISEEKSNVHKKIKS
ncbi:uncharacterized protein J3R85_000265 [Psidium guajava]|nr:uncharacterized protein J3R85_000265 [Psidium guajava]